MNINPDGQSLGLLALINPMVGWIWGATGLMALGGMLHPGAARRTAAAAAAEVQPMNRKVLWWACCWWSPLLGLLVANMGRDPHPIGLAADRQTGAALQPEAGRAAGTPIALEALRGQAGGPQLLGHLVRCPASRSTRSCRARPARWVPRCRFLGVVYEDEEDRVRDFLKQHGQAYPSLLDDGGKAAIAYGVYGVPETYFIEPPGRDQQQVRRAAQRSHHPEGGRGGSGRHGGRLTMRRLPGLLLGLSMLAPTLAWAQSERLMPQLSTETSDVARVVGPPRSQPLSGMQLDARTYQVGSLLRCPVCQGLSVADSPAGMAQNMKGQVRDLLAAGFDQEQILAYFERSYGEFVRLQPPLRGVNWLVWFGPAAGPAGRTRHRHRGPAQAGHYGGGEPVIPSADELPGPDSLPDDPELRRYVLQVRELAYGWPGGISPEKGKP